MSITLYENYEEIPAKLQTFNLHFANESGQKTEIKYNVIAITQEKTTRFYVQKQGYSDLYFLCGLLNVIPKSGIYDEFVYESILKAERENFWKEQVIKRECLEAEGFGKGFAEYRNDSKKSGN